LTRVKGALSKGMRASLIPYPGTTGAPAESITVDIRREGDRLELTYLVRGDTARIRPAAPGEPVRTDELWRHTCFEAFISTDDGYREFNFATTGQWASYSFTGYRQDMAPAAEEAVLTSLEGRGDSLDLGFVVDLPVSAERLALSAVIEDVDGGLSYWALVHPSSKPDFHNARSFTLVLPASETE
jgi:hypothetical protein